MPKMIHRVIALSLPKKFLTPKARRLELDLSGEESKLGKLRTRKTAHPKGSDSRPLISDLPKSFQTQRFTYY